MKPGIELIRQRILEAESQEDREGWETVLANLEKGWTLRGPFEPRGSLQTWEEVLYATIADGTAITAAAETILIPDYTIPGNYLYQGRVLHYTLAGKLSTAITTPGTMTMRLRWGGVAGTVLAASGAFAPDPTAASTNVTWWCEYWVVCRSIGTTGTAVTWGRMDLCDYDDASAATIVGNLNMNVIPTSGLAAVTIDTTTAKALSPTFTQTAATGSITCMYAALETLT